MRRIIILSFIKLIRAPGIRGPVCPRVPRSIWILEPPVFVEIFCVAENIFLGTVSSSHLRATSKTLFYAAPMATVELSVVEQLVSEAASTQAAASAEKFSAL